MNLSEQIRPWDTLACCNQQTSYSSPLPLYLPTGQKYLTIINRVSSTCFYILLMARNISQLRHYLPSYLHTGHKHLTITTLLAFISLYWPQTSHNYDIICLHISILTTNISQLPHYLPSYLYIDHKHLTITTLLAFISLYWPQTSHNYHTTCLHISILTTNISQLRHYLPSYLYIDHKHITITTLPAFISL